MVMDSFSELSLVLGISVLISLILRVLKQPLIIGYIASGILVGPAILNIVKTQDTIDTFANFGIALLLYIIGLGLNPKVIKEVGRVAVLTGLGQVAFTTGVGFLLAQAMGYSGTAAIYISIALAFSSTIIILKLLSDKKEQHRLYGKISIGFLLVQDIIATVALIVASTSGSGNLDVGSIADLVGKGLLLTALLIVIVRGILPAMHRLISSNQELLFTFAIAWGFGVAALFDAASFSLEVGALAAGVALATQPYAAEISSRLRPLRDFFVVIFFIALGTHVKLDNPEIILPQAIALSGFVLIGNPVIVMTIMGAMGYTKKTGFKSGLAVAQISEFSLVFILLGNRLGQISNEVVTLVTLVGLITIAVSSYMIIYADHIYDRISGILGLFERRQPLTEKGHAHGYKMVLIGYRKGGEQFIKLFQKMPGNYVVVDYDPDATDELEHKSIPNIYGDASDPEMLDEIAIDQSKLIVSTADDYELNLLLAKHLKERHSKAAFICSVELPEQAIELYDLGASYVMMPRVIGSEKIASFIKKSNLKKSAFKDYRQKHIDNLHASLIN